MRLFNAIHTLPNIDYACIHIWPNNWGWIGKFNQNYDADKTIKEGAPDPIVDNVKVACDSTLSYINRAYRLMEKAGRPIVLEEFGYPRDGFKFTLDTPVEGRNAYYKYVFWWVVTSATRRFSFINIMRAFWPSPTLVSMYSVCPGNWNPGLWIVALLMGAVTNTS